MNRITVLYHPINAPKGEEFDSEQAERMLAMSNNGGWYSKEDTKQKEDGAISPEPKGTDQVSTKK
jgi:hypothetical protein